MNKFNKSNLFLYSPVNSPDTIDELVRLEQLQHNASSTSSPVG